MNEVEHARDEVLEACRKLGITTVNMLEYANWYYQACQPQNVRLSRLKLMYHFALGGSLRAIEKGCRRCS